MLNVSESAPDDRADPCGGKTAREQVAADALHGRTGGCGVSPKAFFQCLREQRFLVDIREYFGDGRLRDAAIDAQRIELSQHAKAPVPLHMYRRARARKGGAPIVERAFLAQACHRGVDFGLFEPASIETDAKLRLAQLTTGKHPQARNVGIGHASILLV
jgi:hypothetical protein